MQGTVDGVLSGTNRALLGLGAGAVAVSIAAVAAARAARDEPPARPEQRADRAPSSRGNLAVASWPHDLALEQDGVDATLRFQTTIANLGSEPVGLEPGDHVRYTVRRQDATGTPGAVVGHGRLELGRGDLEPFPVPAGHGIGRPLESLGRELQPLAALAPATAALVGAGHPQQAIRIRDARAGRYQLRQEIVRAGLDASSFDDARVTELFLDGRGGILNTSSRYDG